MGWCWGVGWKSYSKVAPSLSLSCTFPVFSGSTCSIQDVPASPEVSGVEFHMGSSDPGQTDRKNTFPNSMFGLVAITGTGSLVAPVLENQNGAMEWCLLLTHQSTFAKPHGTYGCPSFPVTAQLLVISTSSTLVSNHQMKNGWSLL